MYSQTQTNFVLSVLANIGSSLHGSANDIEKELLTMLDGALQFFKPGIGAWSVAWGPAVYQAPLSKVADNAIYIAKKEASDGEPAQLVLAIAGTNGLSIFSIFVLDLWVSQQKLWNPLKPDQGKLSMGSYIGMSTLQNLKPGPNAVKSGYTIEDFLKEEAVNPLAVSVVGHSLGGALSPPLALWLYEKQNNWNPEGNASLSVMPSAGPTSGNGAWAAYYNSCLGDRTNRIWNSKDIVPHAWSMLDGLQNIYAPEIPSSSWIEALVRGAQYLSAGGDYTQIETNNELAGSVLKAIIIPKIGDFANYLSQALYQHTLGYLPLLAIEEAAPLRTAFGNFQQEPDVLKDRLEHERPALELAMKRKG